MDEPLSPRPTKGARQNELPAYDRMVSLASAFERQLYLLGSRSSADIRVSIRLADRGGRRRSLSSGRRYSNCWSLDVRCASPNCGS